MIGFPCVFAASTARAMVARCAAWMVPMLMSSDDVSRASVSCSSSALGSDYRAQADTHRDMIGLPPTASVQLACSFALTMLVSCTTSGVVARVRSTMDAAASTSRSAVQVSAIVSVGWGRARSEYSTQKISRSRPGGSEAQNVHLRSTRSVHVARTEPARPTEASPAQSLSRHQLRR